MPQSLANVLLHIVFSTKYRAPCIPAAVRPGLHAYLATVARSSGCECYRAGGTANHVHLAVRLARTVCIAALVESLKTSSSKWVKTQLPPPAEFAWQRGYGVFSVNPDGRDTLVAYIQRQESHHRHRSFEGEYRRLLKRHAIAYDDRHAWD